MLLSFSFTLILLSPSIKCITNAAKKEIDRFQMIWNAPSKDCIEHYNITIPLTKYGIKANQDQEFSGDEIVLFYSAQLGFYPYVTEEKPERIINGGIPQKVDIHLHYAKMRVDISKAIPRKDFDGIAVIDWEAWRPLWRGNFGKKEVYKRLSIEFVKQRYPSIPMDRARERASKEFDKAARDLMLQTIQFAKKLRPIAKWGYYGFPYCGCDLIGNGKCNKQNQLDNDGIHWLFNASVTVYPTIYLYDSQQSWLQNDRHKYVQGIIEETLRVTKDVKRPYFAFTKFSYDPYADKMIFYKKSDLCSTLKQTADLGGSGVVVWSSTSSVSSASKCEQIAGYIKNLFRLASHDVIQEAQKCSVDRCSRHGTCVMAPRSSCSLASTIDEYNCLCDPGYQGSRCDRISS